MRTIVTSVIYEVTIPRLNNGDVTQYKDFLDEIITSFIPNK